jgi:hypothetical protein
VSLNFTPVHARAWIRQILHCFANRAVLFIVRMPDHTPAAGGILLCHPEMVSVPWASSLRRFNRRNPNMMLYWAFLKFPADNHYPMFDFGRSTPGEGTYSFKKQWGAAPSPLHWADFRPAPGSGNNLLQPIPPKLPHLLHLGKKTSGGNDHENAGIRLQDVRRRDQKIYFPVNWFEPPVSVLNRPFQPQNGLSKHQKTLFFDHISNN